MIFFFNYVTSYVSKNSIRHHSLLSLSFPKLSRCRLLVKSGGSTATSASSISPTSRTRFNYDNPLTSLTKQKHHDSLDSDSTTQLPSMPGPSSVTLGKRKNTQDDTENDLSVKRPHMTDDTSEDEIRKTYSDTK